MTLIAIQKVGVLISETVAEVLLVVLANVNADVVFEDVWLGAYVCEALHVDENILFCRWELYKDVAFLDA